MLHARCISVPVLRGCWAHIHTISAESQLVQRWISRQFRLFPSNRCFATASSVNDGNSISFDHYSYEPLPFGPNFRLLELYPKTHPLSYGGDRIVVSLRPSPLDSTTSAYEALSYNWEDPYAPNLLEPDIPRAQNQYGSISCSVNIDGQYTVPVTPNLLLALRALRLKEIPRMLWIDALCIDQSSLQEKSSQIPLMTDIYSRASKVIIWIGEEDYWTWGSVSVIKRWAAIYTATQRTGAHQPEILARLKEWRTFELEEQACFEAFIRRAWFTRAWTFQELCLAQNAELRCGRYAIPWPIFQDACATVIAAGQESFVFEEHENVKTLVQFYSLCREIPEKHDRANDERFQLSRLLQRARLQQVTDPRDKLYSLLGIANPPKKSQGAYRVDYREGAGDVYRRFTRDMIMEDGDLGVLSAVQRIQSSTKKLEYEFRALAWENAEQEWYEAQARGEEVRSLDESAEDIEHQHVIWFRDAERELSPELFQRPKLEHNDSVVKVLPSWVPDFATQDRVEYVATGCNIRSDLPEDLIRTNFPRPIAQRFSDGKPLYGLQKQLAYYTKSEDITYETGNTNHLGVWGFKVGTIKSVFEMPFTSDPNVRIPVSQADVSGYDDDAQTATETQRELGNLKPRAPPAPSPFNFDFTNRFWPLEDHKLAETEPVLTEHHFYKHTGERTNLALLRTLAADMLPISQRLAENQKKVLFPLHYDFDFWNHGPSNRPREFPSIFTSSSPFNIWSPAYGSNPPMVVEGLRLVTLALRVWRARLALWLRGGDSTTPWTEFDAAELRRGWRIQHLYRSFLVWPWDILTAAWLHSYSAKPSFGFSTLLIGPLFVEGMLKWYWKNKWTIGTPLEGVPTHWVFAAAWAIIYWFGIKNGARWAQRFERDASMPVGWENGAARISKMVNSTFPDKADRDGLPGLWGISCEIQNAVNRASWNREFLVTDNEYIGIGPVGMRPGDEVWVLVGGHVPFVMRPSTLGTDSMASGQYQLVGEGYIHGIMDGEPWQRGLGDLGKMKDKAVKLVLV